jgi:hypothetical protein
LSKKELAGKDVHILEKFIHWVEDPTLDHSDFLIDEGPLKNMIRDILVILSTI